MNNKSLNKILIKQATDNNKKFFYKRSGNCDPSKCGGACCRYTVSKMFEGDQYFEKLTLFTQSSNSYFQV
jgi:hypothetical protein